MCVCVCVHIKRNTINYSTWRQVLQKDHALYFPFPDYDKNKDYFIIHRNVSPMEMRWDDTWERNVGLCSRKWWWNRPIIVIRCVHTIWFGLILLILHCSRCFYRNWKKNYPTMIGQYLRQWYAIRPCACTQLNNMGPIQSILKLNKRTGIRQTPNDAERQFNYSIDIRRPTVQRTAYNLLIPNATTTTQV